MTRDTFHTAVEESLELNSLQGTPGNAWSILEQRVKERFSTTRSPMQSNAMEKCVRAVINGLWLHASRTRACMCTCVTGMDVYEHLRILKYRVVLASDKTFFFTKNQRSFVYWANYFLFKKKKKENACLKHSKIPASKNPDWRSKRKMIGWSCAVLSFKV